MCGIAGYLVERKIDGDVLKRMLSALKHRGPDSEGIYSSGSYNAGMRRLSINDLKTGDQPLYNQDRSVVLFYNGEIYNSPQLRIELEKAGYRFRTRSDGEVICHLYDKYGEKLFRMLDGMFAVALWIKNEKKLILARDIMGEKPLYFSQLNNKEIVFSSELNSLIIFPGLNLNLSYQALWDFPTFTWIPQPHTVYESISALHRGHTLTLDEKGIVIAPYFSKINDSPREIPDEEELIEETREIVTNAVKSRLLSDVPIGCFLSGGLDSSIVSTIASNFLPSLSTFTIGFEDNYDPYHGEADESHYAEAFAKQLGTKHYTIRVTANDFKKDLQKFCLNGGQPFSVPSALGILSVARVANEQGIKVMLSGDCADECFGGYSWYFYLNPEKKYGYIEREKTYPVTFNNFGMGINERLKFLYSYPPQKRAWAWHYYASENEKSKLYNKNAFQNVQSSLRYFYEFKNCADWTPEDFVKQDREFYLPNEMLQKLDLMTMACSVEARPPFAAPAVINFSNKIKYLYMVRKNSLKWVLKEAFRDLLPVEITKRPKHGFNVPIDHWLRNDWKDLFEETFSQNSYLMKTGIIHKKSRDVAYEMINSKARVNGPTIFSFVMLNLWLEIEKNGNNR